MDDTDKKLLESSANAFGIVIDGWHDDADGVPVILYINEKGGHSFFQPLLQNKLTDCMGDALRLAVKLCMSISTGPVIAKANTISGALRGEFPEESTIGALDHYAATRRAIVRAAAEIGKEAK